jgi:hypothetical protein
VRSAAAKLQAVELQVEERGREPVQAEAAEVRAPAA